MRPSLRNPSEVLLITALPEAHDLMVSSLRRRGILVSVAHGGNAAIRRLGRGPSVVLVDLVHGAGLDRSAVSKINRSRGRSLIVALHAGGFGQFHGAVEELSVDGFCPVEDWHPIAGLAWSAMSPHSAQPH
jgi:hypothetical protein